MVSGLLAREIKWENLNTEKLQSQNERPNLIKWAWKKNLILQFSSDVFNVLWYDWGVADGLTVAWEELFALDTRLLCVIATR